MNPKIDLLLNRFLQREPLTAEELRSLKKWIDDPANTILLNNWVQRIWDMSNEVESALQFDDLVQEINYEYQSQQNRKISSSIKFLKVFQRVAAILILPIILLFTYYFFRTNSDLTTDYTEIIVPRGQKSEMVMADGTHVWLNSDSRLKYPTNFLRSRDREVQLEGEAYFEVSKFKHEKFRVLMGRATVEVLGTRFNVKAYPDEQQIETSLLSGRVNLLLKDGERSQKIAMLPGEKIDFNLDQNSLKKSGFNESNVVAWKDNHLVFADDSFDEVVRKIERWYNVQIQYDPAEMENEQLTLELDKEESIERLMEIMGKIMHIEYKINNKNITIKKQNLS
ncbi:FecR family protein [Mangrovibacterium diazotrophicum]|uniref:FecR family protein n=1 Tax=Mangrovibacterium diazotrophicum TaxID=1261403 RepID=A0A419W4D1_9BACT|nr:FecR family protein [Mangrovibacterium diazotrophicum]RKD90309.1 FecR family protein [Mangrovibacterium diazotrophicum]